MHLRPPVVRNLPRCVSVCVRSRCPPPPPRLLCLPTPFWQSGGRIDRWTRIPRASCAKHPGRRPPTGGCAAHSPMRGHWPGSAGCPNWPCGYPSVAVGPQGVAAVGATGVLEQWAAAVLHAPHAYRGLGGTSHGNRVRAPSIAVWQIRVGVESPRASGNHAPESVGSPQGTVPSGLSDTHTHTHTHTDTQTHTQTHRHRHTHTHTHTHTHRHTHTHTHTRVCARL